MTKEERKQRLNKILEVYTTKEISIQQLSEDFEISTPTIRKFLKENGVEIKKVENQKSFLNQALE